MGKKKNREEGTPSLQPPTPNPQHQDQQTEGESVTEPECCGSILATDSMHVLLVWPIHFFARIRIGKVQIVTGTRE